MKPTAAREQRLDDQLAQHGEFLKFVLHPSKGVGPLFFGMPISDAESLAAEWGEMSRGGPNHKASGFKTLMLHPSFEIVLLADDGESLTGVEMWRFEDDTAAVRVDFQGIDVFRTPAHDVVRHLRTVGYKVHAEDEEVVVCPELALLLSRETSREVDMDPEAGLPLHFHYVLAAPSGYFD